MAKVSKTEVRAKIKGLSAELRSEEKYARDCRKDATKADMKADKLRVRVLKLQASLAGQAGY